MRGALALAAAVFLDQLGRSRFDEDSSDEQRA
jgi:hypothetical protein